MDTSRPESQAQGPGHYTHAPIPGVLAKNTLPAGCALVCEGGGTRGFYSSGVFEAFEEAGLMFPYIVGVSAGAANALSYVSGQAARSRQVVEHYVADKRYVSKRNMLLHGSMFGMDFIFHDVPQKHIYFDWDTFRRQQVRLLTGAMDCATGRTVWFEKDDISPQMEATMASCSIPLLAHIVRFKGYSLLDGGISDPVPIEKSIADGNRFHVVVLTRNAGYVKPPFSYKGLLKLAYRRYPGVVRAMLARHKTYMRQIALCEKLEAEGKAVIIRPLKPLQMDRAGSDTAKLLALYDEGRDEGRAKINEILNMVAK